jgi:hypothetical protein
MRDSWLTGVRLARLPVIVRSVGAFPPAGIASERAIRVIWAKCGGPFDEVPLLIDVLKGCGLVRDSDGRMRSTKAGRRVATQDHQQGGRLIALGLIRAGYFAEQTRLLTEAGSVKPDGSFECLRSDAVHAAAQLVGLLRRWPDVKFDITFRVPPALSEELLDVWALVPSQGRDERYRLDVGDRAEFYSYRLERLAASDASSIRWVSREDDRLGYDIENVEEKPTRLIEVKGSGGSLPRFFLSANEWRVAHLETPRYEIHFWGEIDLGRPHHVEYDILREKGFPIVYRNLPRLVGSSVLEVRVSTFELSTPEFLTK